MISQVDPISGTICSLHPGLALGDVETADQVDIEWTDYEKRRYNKYKAHYMGSPALRGLKIFPIMVMLQHLMKTSREI